MTAELRIETSRLVLRQPEPAEADQVVAYYEKNRDHHGPWDPPRHPPFYRIQHWALRLETNRKETSADRSLRMFVYERDAPGVIRGATNLSQFVRGPFQSCSLGYSLDEAVVGRGYMGEALTALTEHAFTRLQLHRVEANYVPTNVRSGAVLRRCGFQVQGYARDYLYIAGAWRDHVLTALTNPDASPPASSPLPPPPE
ncbi:MAG: GNAT family N-acetyltransferase [Planctomycetes bacterium]|nr:GNAT family N-acetyltransferase [Planctomycetota bacterium]